jgi:hypothetical protein
MSVVGIEERLQLADAEPVGEEGIPVFRFENEFDAFAHLSLSECDPGFEDGLEIGIVEID